MKKPTHPKPSGPTINRIADAMSHSDRYAFSGVSRLASDAGVSPSSVSRLINGKMNPSFNLVSKITRALEERFGFRIDPRDLVAESGKFLTPHLCAVVGCEGCIPDMATDEFGDTKPAYQHIKPGRWVTSRYPSGYLDSQKESNK